MPVTSPQPERVLQALKRYMAVEQKDRRHTLKHYQHIVTVDPQKAEQMKFQVGKLLGSTEIIHGGLLLTDGMFVFRRCTRICTSSRSG